MNQEQSQPSRLEIDRLVGGDLSAAETRNVVDQLDTTSDGWKRCALAFMEAQVWEQSLESLLPPATTPMKGTVGPVPARRRRRGALATVAVCAFAIGVGLTMTWDRLRGTSTAPDSVVENESKTKKPSNDGRGGKSTAENQRRVVGLIRVSNEGVIESAFSLVDKSEPELVSVELASKTLSDYDRQLWERRGFRIKQHRKVVSVVLADGNRFQFPVEWTNYRYIGQPVF